MPQQPTTLWRIAKDTVRYAATDLSGGGAKSIGGRWNSKGGEAVYAACSIALATLCHSGVSVALLREEIEARYCHTQAGYGSDQSTPERCRSARKGSSDMNINLSVNEIAFEEGSGNPYADLGLPDAEKLLAKAQLAYEIQTAIERKQLTQQQAADQMGISPAKLLELLRGNFRKIAQSDLSKYLHKLA